MECLFVGHVVEDIYHVVSVCLSDMSVCFCPLWLPLLSFLNNGIAYSPGITPHSSMWLRGVLQSLTELAD